MTTGRPEAAVTRLLEKKLLGSPMRRRNHLARARQIARIIWARWDVQVWRWQVKHVRWYLDVAIRDKAPGTRYHHWLTVRTIVAALSKMDAWESRLRGPWLRPTGESGPRGAGGRPMRLPRQAGDPLRWGVVTA